jgi:hypothetical protein
LDPPRTGGRVELRLSRQQDDEVVYAARWTTPAGTWEGELIVSEAGTLRVAAGDVESEPTAEHGTPPAWLLEWTQQLVRTTARSARSSDRVVWPRRLTRWRRAPEER